MSEAVESPLASLHRERGICLTEFHGALVPSRFSDPAKEHAAVRRAAGIFDFSFRSQFALTGDDRAKFLHRIVSNDIRKLTPGHGTYATLLNAQGHILADFQVYCCDECLLVETDADLHAKTMQSLQRYIIGDRVQIVPVDRFALAVQGPGAAEILRALVTPAPALSAEYDHTAAEFAGMPVHIIRATSTGEEGYEIWADSKNLAPLWNSWCGQAAANGLVPVGMEALESLRIEAGTPRYGADMGEDTIPLEAGLLNALSFNKGCYIGQEIVERARSRGHVNWKLSGLLVEGSQSPAAGEKLTADGREIGEVTSACASPTLGRIIAMAYLRKEVAKPGTRVNLASGAAATVAALPFYTRATA